MCPFIWLNHRSKLSYFSLVRSNQQHYLNGHGTFSSSFGPLSENVYRAGGPKFTASGTSPSSSSRLTLSDTASKFMANGTSSSSSARLIFHSFVDESLLASRANCCGAAAKNEKHVYLLIGFGETIRRLWSIGFAKERVVVANKSTVNNFIFSR